jgi:hypothetical protein
MYFLLIILYTGQVKVYEYPNAVDCESSLIQKTDVGNYKKIKTAVCINSEETRQ